MKRVLTTRRSNSQRLLTVNIRVWYRKTVGNHHRDICGIYDQKRNGKVVEHHRFRRKIHIVHTETINSFLYRYKYLTLFLTFMFMGNTKYYRKRNEIIFANVYKCNFIKAEYNCTDYTEQKLWRSERKEKPPTLSNFFLKYYLLKLRRVFKIVKQTFCLQIFIYPKQNIISYWFRDTIYNFAIYH